VILLSLRLPLARGGRVGVKSSDSPNTTCPGSGFHGRVHQALAHIPHWARICVRQAEHENPTVQNVLFGKVIGCSKRAMSKLGEATVPSVQRKAVFQNVPVFVDRQFLLHQDLCYSTQEIGHLVGEVVVCIHPGSCLLGYSFELLPSQLLLLFGETVRDAIVVPVVQTGLEFLGFIWPHGIFRRGKDVPVGFFGHCIHRRSCRVLGLLEGYFINDARG